ncbi:MAG TPA: FmdB family zinc ribbon protein [Bryobacteraceae bacterium]|nr:FmdB family zinc ribbon protein [Bryobacteraceae bacterium]
MPIYQYLCENCGEQFDVIQKFADEPLSVHPKCGGAVHRMMTAPAFQFKGSGWYVNDYAKKPAAGSGGASDPGSSDGKTAETKSDSQSETKSDTKTETKTESKSDTSSSAPTPTSTTKTS